MFSSLLLSSSLDGTLRPSYESILILYYLLRKPLVVVSK